MEESMILDACTRICALIGDPVAHSFSPLIHNAAFQEAEINCAYVAFHVKKEHLADAIKGIRSLSIRGVSVTIPHKVRIIEFLDHLDPAARQIGSVNTVVNEQGVLTGYNSDGLGALKAFEDHRVDLSGKSVLILGSGGAARAIAVTLVIHTGIRELFIAGIIEEEVATLVAHLRTICRIPIAGDMLTHTLFGDNPPTCDVLINCTPVGMHPDVGHSPVPSSFFREGLTVFDVVYNPVETAFLKAAAAAGCQTISGLEMFLNQATVQFELWTGAAAPKAVMRKVVREYLGVQ